MSSNNSFNDELTKSMKTHYLTFELKEAKKNSTFQKKTRMHPVYKNKNLPLESYSERIYPDRYKRGEIGKDMSNNMTQTSFRSIFYSHRNTNKL